MVQDLTLITTVAQERPGAKIHPVTAHDEPSNDYGLRPLDKLSPSSEANPAYAADIIFVHGLNGHWRRTWTHENGLARLYTYAIALAELL